MAVGCSAEDKLLVGEPLPGLDLRGPAFIRCVVAGLVTASGGHEWPAGLGHMIKCVNCFGLTGRGEVRGEGRRIDPAGTGRTHHDR